MVEPTAAAQQESKADVSGGPPAAKGGAESGRRPLIVAHRGAWGVAPQNSIEAFERAIALGCDAVELDVRRTASGHIVVVHDARVGGRLVARTETPSLRRRLEDGQAPALVDVLDAVAGRIKLDIELKETGYVEEVMALIQARLPPEQYVVTSFRDEVLPEVKHHVGDVRTGMIIRTQGRRNELERRVRHARVDFIVPHAAIARGGLLDWAAEQGLPAWLWTVKDRRSMQRLQADHRVEALITDRPERAVKLASSAGR
jgi:glycerophosphoryl diester phosphodiesterase